MLLRSSCESSLDKLGKSKFKHAKLTLGKWDVFFLAQIKGNLQLQEKEYKYRATPEGRQSRPQARIRPRPGQTRPDRRKINVYPPQGAVYRLYAKEIGMFAIATKAISGNAYQCTWYNLHAE